MSFMRNSDFPNYGATSSNVECRPRTLSDVSLYNQLCDNISCNIFSINNNVAALETACKDTGTKFDSESLRDKIHGYRQSTNELVGTTTRFVTELQRMVQRGVGKEQRFQAKRLENEFRETLKRYDALQKQLVPKMKQALLSSEVQKQNIWGMKEQEEEQQSLIDAEKEQQRQQQMQTEYEFEHGLLLEREQRIRQIESDILDVNAAFKDLSLLVQEQGDMVGTIEENITTVAHEVEAGTEQLSKASNYQKKYRTKLCWLILILLIVSALITTVIVIESAK